MKAKVLAAAEELGMFRTADIVDETGIEMHLVSACLCRLASTGVIRRKKKIVKRDLDDRVRGSCWMWEVV